MLKKAKIYSLLLLIVASTAVGLISVPQNTNAQSTDNSSTSTSTDTKLHIDKDIVDDANVVTMAHVVSWCIEGTSKNVSSGNGGGGTDIAPKQSDIRDGNWFNNFKNDSEYTDNQFAYGSYSIPVGYGIKGSGDDGKISCKDDEFNVAQAFYTAAGWSDSKTAACDLGFRMEGSGQDSDGENRGYDKCLNFDEKNSGKKYLGQKRDERGDDGDPLDQHFLTLLPRGENKTGGYGYNDIQMYALYGVAFTKACGAEIIGVADQSSGYEKVFIVNEAGEKVEVDYKMPDSKKDDPVPVAYNTTIACKDLAGLMNGTADAYGGWLRLNGASGDADLNGANLASSCQITAIGWIICPVVNFLAGVVDGSYWALDRLFLRLPPVNLDTSDATNGMYKAWSVMRDLANIVFVLAFLIIVFSQVTNIGITNYGMKRLIPKLIMAAILVNLSYLLCAIAVDVSNIIGSSLKDLLDTIRVTTVGTATELNSGGGFWKDTAVKALAVSLVAGAVVLAWATAGLLLVGLLAIVPIILTVLITMLVRQAFVVLLIVIAPLAFVALLLPNTEGYYKKWLELFKAMLMLYPIVALLFGASALASDILMSAAKDSGGDGFQALNGIVAGVVRIMPLVLIPAVMKISTGVFGKITGMVNDRHKGWFDNKRNSAMNMHKMQQQRGYKLPGMRGRIGGMRAMAGFANNPGGNRATRLGRRAIGSVSPYGSNARKMREEKLLAEADNIAKESFYGSGDKKNTDAIDGAKNAEIRLNNAQVRVETARIEGIEGLALQRETTATERNKQRADNESMTQAINALPTALSQGLEASERTKLTAENNAKSGGLSALAATAAGEAILEAQKKSEIDKKGADDTADSIGSERVNTSTAGQLSIENTKNAEIRKHAADDTTATIGNERASHTLEGIAKEASVNRKASEGEAEAEALARVGGSVSGQAALKRLEDAENLKKSNEDETAAIAKDRADRATAARAEEAALTKETAENNLVRDSAPLVSNAARVATADSKNDRKIAEGLIAADVARGTNRALANDAKDAELIQEAEEARLAGAAQGSTTARVDAANTELKRKEAESLAAADTAIGTDRAIATDAKDAELIQKDQENILSTYVQKNADDELKIKAETSANQLSTAQNEDKQTYAEIAAQGGGVGTVAHSLGISDTVANAARDSSFESKAVNNAVSDAKYEGEVAYAKEMQRTGSALPDIAGGRIDPIRGAATAIKEAKAVENRAFVERVKSQKDAMGEYQPTRLLTEMSNTALPLEQRAGAAAKFDTNGGAGDVMEAWNQIQAMRAQAVKDYATGVTTDDTEIKNIQAIQQMFSSDVGRAGKLPSSIITGDALGKMARGEAVPSIEQEILATYDKGDFSGKVMASLHPKQLARVAQTFADKAATDKTFTTTDKFKNLKTSIEEYQEAAPRLGLGLTDEQTRLFGELRSI